MFERQIWWKSKVLLVKKTWLLVSNFSTRIQMCCIKHCSCSLSTVINYIKMFRNCVHRFCKNFHQEHFKKPRSFLLKKLQQSVIFWSIKRKCKAELYLLYSVDSQSSRLKKLTWIEWKSIENKYFFFLMSLIR